MTDIVERLRQGVDIDYATGSFGGTEKVMDDAAAEIERLRFMIRDIVLAIGCEDELTMEEVERALDDPVMWVTKIADEAAAEIKRLRNKLDDFSYQAIELNKQMRQLNEELNLLKGAKIE